MSSLFEREALAADSILAGTTQRTYGQEKTVHECDK